MKREEDFVEMKKASISFELAPNWINIMQTET